jgi:hypothetical protein
VTTTPTTGPVSSHFGARKPPKLPDGTFGSSWHNGTDLSAPTGQPVVAPQAGTVTLAEFNTVRGTNVIVDHGRYRTRHQHLHSMTVTVGQGVAEGQVIGTVGNTGASSGAHLHTEVHDGTTPIDPEPWYAARGVTLGVAMAVLSEHEAPAPHPTPAHAQEDDMIELIRLLYRALNDREGPDLDVLHWSDQAANNGWNAAELHRRFAAHAAESGTVRAAYRHHLNREPSAADVAHWSRGRSVAQVWDQIAASPEAIAKR